MDDKNLKIAIGKRFAEVRKTKGLSQVVFSKQLGVSSATVANIERGFIYPNMDLLYYLIFKEGVNPYWLFSGSGVMFALSKDLGPGINLDKHFVDPEVKGMIDLLNVPKVKRSLLSYVDQLREIFSADIAAYLRSKPGEIESSREAAEMSDRDKQDKRKRGREEERKSGKNHLCELV